MLSFIAQADYGTSLAVIRADAVSRIGGGDVICKPP